MKVRSRAVKPKTLNDFAKKKVKVGRKVKRANVTEIKVKSRRIVVPLQNQGVLEDGESSRDAINRVIKQLHHYAESTRLNALNKVKDMLNSTVEFDSFVTLMLPEVVELLFNDEKEPRNVVTEVFSLMLGKYPSDVFLPVISVAITYICSGLTHLHKGIRKDSLVLLKAIALKYPELLVPYMEKVLKHTLLLLTDSFQAASAPLVQQRDVQISATQVTASKAMAGAAGVKGVKPTMFILILEVLAALLEFEARRTSNSFTASRSGANGVQFSFNPTFASNAALLLSGFGMSRNGQSIGNDSSASAAKANTSNSNGLPIPLLLEILDSTGTVWQNLVMNSSSVSIDTIASLHAVTRILLSISHSVKNQGLDLETKHRLWARFNAILGLLFRHFPHSCIEATLAPAGSEKDRVGRQKVEQLDVALCEIAFIYISSLDQADSETTGITVLGESATAFLLQILRSHTETISSLVGKLQVPTEIEKLATTKIFKSFQLMMSRNTLTALMELLQLLGKLFAALSEVSVADRRSVRYMTGPASECLCTIIDRIHHELSGDYTEELYVNLIETLSAALSLALTATWDQTTLLAKLINATLLLTQGNALSGTFVTAALSAALVKLSISYESLWVKSSESVDTIKSQKNVFRNDFFSLGEAARRQVLDVFMFAPFEDFFSTAGLISDCLVSKREVTLAEQSYFLRILFERRQELGLRDFVDLLFTSLQLFIDTRADLPAPRWGERWYAHEVAEVLTWMASSEAPAKVVHFLAESVQELMDRLAEGSATRASAQLTAWVRSAVLVLSRRLLVPWIATTGVKAVHTMIEDETLPDAATVHKEQDAVRRLVDWLTQNAVALLTEETASSESLAESNSESLATLFSTRVVSMESATASSSHRLYLVVLQDLQQANHLGLQTRENILRNLHAVLQRPSMDDSIFVQCRPELIQCAETVGTVSAEQLALLATAEDKNKVELIRNLATDILAFF
eukprot:CAMPEP_0184989504 /NCGR_PEP_ID=MMETSP1098-20130426/28766_1 /TAXON_ID=89044 /ORGANISM="Spumella elongata, Strain CCAP 955/1" /LENGTH=976 /DNA_ID=CAMNT_0027514525 /DNA_START=17 /DNA_END=2947 /DNA_ORIENTATION=-